MRYKECWRPHVYFGDEVAVLIPENYNGNNKPWVRDFVVRQHEDGVKRRKSLIRIMIRFIMFFCTSLGKRGGMEIKLNNRGKKTVSAYVTNGKLYRFQIPQQVYFHRRFNSIDSCNTSSNFRIKKWKEKENNELWRQCRFQINLICMWLLIQAKNQYTVEILSTIKDYPLHECQDRTSTRYFFDCLLHLFERVQHRDSLAVLNMENECMVEQGRREAKEKRKKEKDYSSGGVHVL